jgi:hypothetical protein
MRRAPRPRVTKLTNQRIITSRRFWKPMRYQKVDHQPGDPGREAAEPDEMEVGDRGGAADRRQVALVPVAERPGSAPRSRARTSFAA